ncbi:YaeQ family protein [Pseudoalteromonas denitrificans]|uniref:Uncharacterized conserved protein YaeQ, suppresses RfaH defect n=1 Tax=Pseudoalteromonas denitrificans DSM 6059 TaxID=1123010 RepID=A0A1I1QDE3_9GAMM|nr:YaeQ family protein [Pseudoalteromonas denitrificans]SFD20002.1 Uncharacterized conserved protein YaeQ, suppresses RfaH defect [Pseudoalteromonas denitrificans DSM 6059]
MADKTKLFKAHLDVADINHHRYEHKDFTLALLPNEDTQHFLLKLIGYSLLPLEQANIFSHNTSSFNPDVGIQALDEHFEVWLDAGFPSLKRVDRACHKSEQVIILTPTQSSWLDENKHKLRLLDNLHLISLDNHFIQKIEDNIVKKLDWSVILENDKITISDHCDFYETQLNELSLA